MCGIIGYVGDKSSAVDYVINGLEKLEYRGYDSAGIGYVFNNNVVIKKNQGRVKNLKSLLEEDIKSNIAIGHTRWATHGEANELNSHPHKVGNITIVHNGIIENFQSIKSEMTELKFLSDTDTEVGAALLNQLYKKEKNMLNAIKEFQSIVKGSYAIAAIVDDDLDTIYAIKNASPLLIGVGISENFIASDMPSILEYADKYVELNDGDFASISKNEISVFNNMGEEKKYVIKNFKGRQTTLDKNGYDHYMLKEIHEQPEIVKEMVKTYLEDKNNFLNLKLYNKIKIVACGSAMHAGLVGKCLIEKYAHKEVDVEIASEFRYKENFLNKKDLVIFISQSGETADTLACVKKVNNLGVDTLGIINVEESSIARETKYVLYTKAGNEIAVATTKAYMAQTLLLAILALKMSDNLIEKELAAILKTIPNEMEKVLSDTNYKEIAKKIHKKNDIYFIGRGIDYALCLEGSLKLKEISYLHSEAYAAGELKHGTISLIEENTPVISIITDKYIAEKTISNIKEVKTRGAYVILIISSDIEVSKDIYDEIIVIPEINKIFQFLLTIVPLQLIAYETAKLNKCDIDKPKNLAKSVTVE